MQLGQFSASVSVDGVKLSEYAVEQSADGKQVTCWIPSENDKQFCVKFKNTDARKTYPVSSRVFVDGIKCGGRLLQIRRDNVSKGSRDSVSTSADKRRPLTFSQQALTDDDAYLNAAISPDLGTIRVVFNHVNPLGTSKRWKGREGRFQPQTLHERSKKAMGHSVQSDLFRLRATHSCSPFPCSRFGPEFRQQNRRCHSEHIEQLVTFVFKYRPIGLLRAEGIAPPAPRQERAATPTDILDLTMDADTDDDTEIKQLEARLGALKNKKKRVKREPGEVKKEIKSEEPIFKPGEVIDLT
ncbi:hypothetical protein B0H17DRAFT_1073664 [Mycena rosella]|uniref:DUF7918 domain-containing protein n=1 Tax=Mycena rosella TaxID=1033263 RepID=A0AAD7GAI4_MYCRO|nr:hypothetical protein B0H17DRAFT_1073664 [Mycena rosella]